MEEERAFKAKNEHVLGACFMGCLRSLLQRVCSKSNFGSHGHPGSSNLRRHLERLKLHHDMPGFFASAKESLYTCLPRHALTADDPNTEREGHVDSGCTCETRSPVSNSQSDPTLWPILKRGDGLNRRAQIRHATSGKTARTGTSRSWSKGTALLSIQPGTGGSPPSDKLGCIRWPRLTYPKTNNTKMYTKMLPSKGAQQAALERLKE